MTTATNLPESARAPEELRRAALAHAQRLAELWHLGNKRRNDLASIVHNLDAIQEEMQRQAIGILTAFFGSGFGPGNWLTSNLISIDPADLPELPTLRDHERFDPT